MQFLSKAAADIAINADQRFGSTVRQLRGLIDSALMVKPRPKDQQRHLADWHVRESSPRRNVQNLHPIEVGAEGGLRERERASGKRSCAIDITRHHDMMVTMQHRLSFGAPNRVAQ